VAQWTQSTTCVQSADPAIRAKADELARGTDDVESYVRNVIAFTSTNKGEGAKFNALDAKRALLCGGSCTSRANLAAALLRAHGVAARTLSHLPAWYPHGCFEHWLVEYWHPGVGWVWAESTLGLLQPAPNQLVVLAESSADDENKALDPIHLRYIMPGAAYLSGPELSKELTAADLIDSNSSNTAVTQGEIKGSPAQIKSLLDQARQSFASLSPHTSASRTQAIELAVQHGDANELTAAVAPK
jgi:hypothetical protein